MDIDTDVFSSQKKSNYIEPFIGVERRLTIAEATRQTTCVFNSPWCFQDIFFDNTNADIRTKQIVLKR